MERVYKLYVILVRSVFWIAHRIRHHGRENLPVGPAIICANHSANKDSVILALACGMNYYMRFMAKIELMHIPLLGNLLKKCGVFYVDRGNSDVTAIKTAMQTLKDGARVAIFPEGRRVSAEEASAAKTGAIMLASRTGAPIVPVYIPKVKHFGTAVDVYIGKPYTIERVRGGSEVYAAYADELMRRINALAPEKVPG